jgi:hypothetical protein
VNGIVGPRVERLEAGELSVITDVVDMGGGGLDVVAERVVSGVDDKATEVTAGVDMGEMVVDVIGVSALTAAVMITTEDGKLSSTVAYPLVS